jgi:diaminopimelate decarboxylase
MTTAMNISELSAKQAPFYLIDLDAVRKRFGAFKAAFAQHFPQLIIGYSYKTNYVPLLLNALHAEGAYAEVVSELEYNIAERLGVGPREIIYNGVNKTRESLHRALHGGSLCNLDSLEEVSHVTSIAKAGSFSGKIGVRLSMQRPEGEGTRPWSRLGLALPELEVAKRSLADAGVKIASLHGHLSSKSRSTAVAQQVATELKNALEIVGADDVEFIDVGGGYGHAPAELGLSFPTLEQYADAYAAVLGDVMQSRTLIIEPGISMIGDCIDYYAPVTAIKHFASHEVLFVDASVHTIKPSGHSLNLPTTVLTRELSEKAATHTRTYDVVGYTCMDEDFVSMDQELPETQVGDVLRIKGVGAYTIVFKPQFIRAAPRIYTVEDRTVTLARREENADDFLASYTVKQL